jgi:drug/metabolite transporter (DMT)-like permease
MTSSIWPVLLGTGVFLGLGLPLARLAAAEGVGPLAFALWPTALAGLLLWPLGRLRGPRRAWTAAHLRFGLIAGLFGHALPMTAAYALSARAGAGFTALAFTLPPVFTLAIALALRLEPAVPRRLLAVAFGVAGALLLVAGRGVLPTSAGDPGAAVALVVAIPAVIAGANVYRSLRLPADLPPAGAGALTLLSSSALLAVFGVVFGGAQVPLTGPALGWLALQTVALVAGYTLYFMLQARAEPVTFSFMGYVVMATGVAVGVLAFGERLPATTLPALGLITLALLLIRRSASRRTAAPGGPGASGAPGACHVR